MRKIFIALFLLAGLFAGALSIHLEANFTQQGGGYEIPNTPSDEGHRGKLKLNYINVPVTARYESKGGLYAEVGMQAGFLLSAKNKLYQLAVEERDVKNTYWENEDRNLVMSAFLTYSFTDKKNQVRHTKPRKHDQN